MHKSCITKWKQKFETAGLDGIKLSRVKSYLTLEQRDVVITWLQTKEYINIDEHIFRRTLRCNLSVQAKLLRIDEGSKY